MVLGNPHIRQKPKGKWVEGAVCRPSRAHRESAKRAIVRDSPIHAAAPAARPGRCCATVMEAARPASSWPSCAMGWRRSGQSEQAVGSRGQVCGTEPPPSPGEPRGRIHPALLMRPSSRVAGVLPVEAPVAPAPSCLQHDCVADGECSRGRRRAAKRYARREKEQASSERPAATRHTPQRAPLTLSPSIHHQQTRSRRIVDEGYARQLPRLCYHRVDGSGQRERNAIRPSRPWATPGKPTSHYAEASLGGRVRRRHRRPELFRSIRQAAALR